MAERLAGELLDGYNRTGVTMKRKKTFCGWLKPIGLLPIPLVVGAEAQRKRNVAQATAHKLDSRTVRRHPLAAVRNIGIMAHIDAGKLRPPNGCCITPVVPTRSVRFTMVLL
jgi:hypothetical protein